MNCPIVIHIFFLLLAHQTSAQSAGLAGLEIEEPDNGEFFLI
tara:strand:- start:994 stop:1119 length:126 start_codon:yes stop_codon:yes gene_type:complete